MTEKKILNFLSLYYVVIGRETTFFFLIIRLNNHNVQLLTRFAIFFFQVCEFNSQQNSDGRGYEMEK